MYAIVVRPPGGPDDLVWTQVPDPEPGPGEVLVRVAAAGVNRADLLQRAGLYPPPPGAPEYLGLECSGLIAATGPGVAGWSVGDRVCALLTGGGYAERVCVPAGTVLSVPEGLDLRTAAALPEACATVWSNLVMTADLRAGELLLVHGGASGIGTMAIQVARARGARVAVTASAGKLEACARLGAQVTCDYSSGDFVAVVRAASHSRGADVILDIMGGSYLARNVAALAEDGRLVVIGLQGGRTGELDLGVLLAKRGSLHATGLRGRSLAAKELILAQVREQLWPLLATGVVRPVVAQVVDMPYAGTAHRILEAATHVGKLLLEVPGGPR